MKTVKRAKKEDEKAKFKLTIPFFFFFNFLFPKDSSSLSAVLGAR